MKTVLIIGLVLILCATQLVGCSLMRKGIDKYELGAQLVVKAAVGRLLDKHTSLVAPTYALTLGAKKLFETEELVQLQKLEDHIVARIDWASMSPEERDLVRILISAVRDEIQLYLQEKGIKNPQERVVYVAKVLTWVGEAVEVRR